MKLMDEATWARMGWYARQRYLQQQTARVRELALTIHRLEKRAAQLADQLAEQDREHDAVTRAAIAAIADRRRRVTEETGLVQVDASSVLASLPGDPDAARHRLDLTAALTESGAA